MKQQADALFENCSWARKIRDGDYTVIDLGDEVIREKTGEFVQRKSGANRIKHGRASSEGRLYSLRKLQKDVIDFK